MYPKFVCPLWPVRSRLFSRTFLAVLVAWAALSLGAAPQANHSSAQPAAMGANPLARVVSTIGLTVDDMDRSIEFFRDVLEFELESDVEVDGEAYEHLYGIFGVRLRVVIMKLGEERIELTEFLVPKGRPVPPDSRSNDRWFQHIAIITHDMERAYAHLRQYKVRHVSSGPQTLPEWNHDAGGIKAFYFLDPDGHVLEILQFPDKKGNAKWRERATKASADHLFLGIDHTAIVIDDTKQSLSFYRDWMGLRVAGTSHNYGPEQERLNNVFGARLSITSLATGGNEGPAIEFLEYEAPSGGRPYPADSRSNDLWHWHITIETDDLNRALQSIVERDIAWVSSGIVLMPQANIGFPRGAVIRDPDGHSIRLIER
jgi:catechol 2,3-dioxygenase-like lactoylglutathione lyase family enzyme